MEIENSQKEILEDSKLNWGIIVLLILAGVLIIFSCLAPYLFTQIGKIDFTQTGAIGDTIGRLMGPFINISALIITGLAFFMQYKANRLQVKIFQKQLADTKEQFTKEQERQQRQLDIQRFEGQFFEMLHLHKENVSEINIQSLFERDKNSYVGRNCFNKIIKDFNSILLLIKCKINRYSEYEIENSVLEFGEGIDINDNNFSIAYSLIWHGYNKDEIYHIKDDENDSIDLDDANISSDFLGYGQVLGHYYRHLFSIVKLVANSTALKSNSEKQQYLSILRSQLSNSEQCLLFYNWLSGYGYQWENDNNHFFTEYRMIHNLDKELLVIEKSKSFELKIVADAIERLGKMPNSLSNRIFQFQE